MEGISNKWIIGGIIVAVLLVLLARRATGGSSSYVPAAAGAADAGATDHEGERIAAETHLADAQLAYADTQNQREFTLAGLALTAQERIAQLQSTTEIETARSSAARDEAAIRAQLSAIASDNQSAAARADAEARARAAEAAAARDAAVAETRAAQQAATAQAHSNVWAGLINTGNVILDRILRGRNAQTPNFFNSGGGFQIRL